MPSGTFIVQNATIVDFSSWIGSVIENLDWQIKEQIRRGDEFVIKAATRSKLEAWVWHKFVPFGKWMRRGQRVGIEVHLQSCAGGVLVGMAVVPYIELFDTKEIFLISQGLIERFVDNRYSEEVWEQLMSKIKQRYKLTSPAAARFLPNAYLKCLKCNWLNPSTADHCKNCGAELKTSTTG